MVRSELMRQAICEARIQPAKAKTKGRPICFAVRRGELVNACLEPGFAKDSRPHNYTYPTREFEALVFNDTSNAATEMSYAMLPEFFSSFAKTRFFTSWLRIRQRINASPNIQEKDFRTLEVPVPSLHIQKALVSELEAARAKRNKLLAEANRLLGSMDGLVKQRLCLSDPPTKTPNGYGVRLIQLRGSPSISAARFHPERIHALKSVQAIPHAPLGSLVSFERRKSHTSDARYVGLASVSSHTGQFLGVDEITADMRFAFDTGDILYGRLRPYLNKCWLANFSGECSTEFFVMRVLDKKKIMPAYLSLVMRTQVVSIQTKYIMTGSALPRLSQEDAENLLIPIAEMEIQQRLITETSALQLEAERLSAQAELIWQKACESFEHQLTGA